MSKTYFVTGIGTGVGKTLVSTILTEALKADYYKPIQCGDLDSTDADFVQEHLFNSRSKVHPTSVLLRLAASPHAAAMAEGKSLKANQILLPSTTNKLLVEGAGGVLVPLNENKEYIIDIARINNLEIILVVDYYLGSINHTLLTLNYLLSNNFKIALIVFNGDKVETSKRAILKEAQNIPFVEIDRFDVSPESIKEQADSLAQSLENLLNVK